MAVDLEETGPYVGPQPFEPRHREVFFGRFGELQQLRTMVLGNQVVLLYAGSGAGKTSLLNAGLVPRLEQEDGFEVMPVARVGRPEPGADLAEGANPYVRGVLASWLPKSEGRQRVPEVTLAEFLGDRPHPLAPDEWSAPRLVVIDQLEEVFTLAPHRWEQRDQFFEQLGEAVRADPLLRVVLAIREDYTYEIEPQRVRLPGRLKARFRLELLREPAALEAVVRPLAETDREFAPGVAEQLVRNLRTSSVRAGTAEEPLLTEFVEPVQLQVTCAALWQRLPEGRTTITEDDVRSFGDVDQALRALYDSAIEAAAAAAGIEEKHLRDDFAKEFITSIDTRGNAYLSDESVGGIPWAAIEVLEKQHVIRAEWRAGARWYELTHDRFIPPVRQSNRRFVLRELTGLRLKGRAVPVLLEDRGGLARLAGKQREADPGFHDDPVLPDDEPSDPGIALCLTGSGFRSMLFTAGALWRLGDAGYLPRLRQIASNSAAAVTAAMLGLRWEQLQLDAAGSTRRFEELVAAPLHELADATLDTKVMWSWLVRRRNGNAELAREYRRRVFGRATLAELPDMPRFVFTASHLESGELWRFEKQRVGNRRAGWAERPGMAVAVAVAASGAAPPVFSPAVLEDDGVELTSGALYDTLALETAWRRYETVLVCDGKASRPIAHVQRGRATHFMDFAAASDTELHRLRRQQALLAFTTGIKRGGYWSINSDIGSFPVHHTLPCPPEKTAELAATPGRLSRLDRRLQERLVNWGYAVTDAAIRAHVDGALEPPAGFPYPDTGVG